MLVKIRKMIGTEKGQSLVELALILPVLITILMGIVEFGRIFNAYLVINQASREGSRIGVVGGTDSQITNTVKTVAGTLDLSRLTIDISPSQSSRKRGDNLVVKVNYKVSFITPFFGTFVPDPFPLSAATTMRVE